jgi:hypothetical protein
VVDNLGGFTEEGTYERFNENHKTGKYKLRNQVSYTHPILTKFSDLKAVGGYSDNMDLGWHPGYSCDNSFAFRLKQLHPDFQFITLGDWCVYHAISATNNKLPPEIKARNGINHFIHKYGQHWQDFNNRIGLFNELQINT